MTVWYIDPIGGSDASAGNSFAARMQSFAGLNGKSVVAGDSVRVMKSADPTDMGQTATWTFGSQTITLSTAVTKDVTQATSAWTPSTNVTATTSTARKLGTTSSSIAPNASFTTGLIAYLALGSTQDFSAYQQLSFWISMTSGAMSADNQYQLVLCSDTAGATPVNTFNIPYIKATTQWQAITVDLGTNLGSSIQSIALYRTSKTGANTILLNNILACKASSSVDSLSLTSLIGKNTTNEPWLPIQSISGTTVLMSCNQQYSLASGFTLGGYGGTSETVEVWKRQPTVLPSAFVAATSGATTFGNWSRSGSSGNVITISGGWDTTAMSSQTGQTYISGVNGFGTGFGNNTYTFNTISALNIYNFNNGILVGAGSTLTASDVSHNSDNVLVYATASTFPGVNCTITNCQSATSIAFTVGSTISYAGSSISIVNLNSNQGYGMATGGYQLNISVTNANCNGYLNVANGVNSAFSLGGAFSNLSVVNAKNNGNSAILFSGNSLYNITCSGSFTVPTGATSSPGSVFNLGSSSSGNIVNCSGATFDCSGAAGLRLINCTATPVSTGNKFIGGTWTPHTSGFIIRPFAMSDFILDNYTLTQGGAIDTSVSSIYSVALSRIGGNNNTCITYRQGAKVSTNTSTVHTAGGISWQFDVTSSVFPIYSSNPCQFPVAQVAVNSGSLVTASIWVYLTNANNNVQFVCPSGQLSGVSPIPVVANTGTLNSWQQLTMTFTPSAAGVVQFYVYFNTPSKGQYAYIDDFSVSQA